jgi:hypothetical protein
MWHVSVVTVCLRLRHISTCMHKYTYVCSMRSMRSMRGGFIFRNRGPSLKVHHGQCLTSMTKHDSGGSPPGTACDSAKPPHDKTRGSTSGWRSRLSPYSSVMGRVPREKKHISDHNWPINHRNVCSLSYLRRPTGPVRA